MAFKISSLACSVRSLIHGVSLVFALAVIVACWAGLWQITQAQFYPGNNNSCFVTTSAAFYGGDNVLYCPNAHIISEVQVVDPSNIVTAMAFAASGVEDVPIGGSIESPPFTAPIQIDDDDSNVYWYFNMNPGSSLSLNFTEIQSSGLWLQVDDEDQQEIGVPDDYWEFSVDSGSKGYKIEVHTNNITQNDSFQGYVMFNYNMTFFGTQPGPENLGDFSCTNRLSNCTWELDFEDEVCISMWTAGVHYFGNNYEGACIGVNQLGRQWWSAILIPTSIILVAVIILFNVAICVGWSFVSSRRKDEYPVEVDDPVVAYNSELDTAYDDMIGPSDNEL